MARIAEVVFPPCRSGTLRPGGDCRPPHRPSPATATGEPLRRTLLATLALALTLPATAVGAEEGASATEEDVTLFMMILIGALIALGLIIVAIESKRGK